MNQRIYLRHQMIRVKNRISDFNGSFASHVTSYSCRTVEVQKRVTKY